MSCTEIYVVGESSCTKVGEVKNAWRGAMYVWSDIAVRYFGLSGFPHFDGEMQRRIWNAHNEKPLSEDEIIVLSSTMDRATVKLSDIPRLVKAFRAYGEKHAGSSLLEQAEIIEKAYESGVIAKAIKDNVEGALLAWCQTTVSGFIFAPHYAEPDEASCELCDGVCTGETDALRGCALKEEGWYEFASLEDAWDIFEQYDNEIKPLILEKNS